MSTFRLPLPPSSNHGYKLGLICGSPRLVKTEGLIAWESECSWVVRTWCPPPRTPLAVRVVAYFPRRAFRQADLDGVLKFLIDAVVGRRKDHWVDRIVAEKVATDGDGWAEVTVEPALRALGVEVAP